MYHQKDDKTHTYELALKDVNYRGKYLNSEKLERVYADFVSLFKVTPRTLCHDDLLPFNVLVGDKAVFIDLEYGGIHPYLTSFARLIAHSKDDPNYLFYMSKEDKEFAVEYYYENLAKKHGISYENYRLSLDYFLFYEYCEWIMLGNCYGSKEERFYYYLNLANDLADKLERKKD